SPLDSSTMITEIDCRRLPKVELHAHLNGSISLKTIEKLRYMRSTPVENGDHGNCLALTQPTTMDDCDGVVYLELRSTPKTTAEMSKKEYVGGHSTYDGSLSKEAPGNLGYLLLADDMEECFYVIALIWEVSNQLEEVDEFLALRPDRIGHGTYLHTSENFVKQSSSSEFH
ncbi:hypothetical protein OSTOST_21667, partial [Ostertagia ostertagi]